MTLQSHRIREPCNSMLSLPKLGRSIALVIAGGLVGYWIGASSRHGSQSDQAARLAEGAKGREQKSQPNEGGSVGSNSRETPNQHEDEHTDPRLLPKNGAMLRREALVNIWMNKGKAITRLGLDSQRKSKLIDLLVDQYAAQQDTFDIVRKSGPNGPENGDDILETVSQAYEKNIADFLV